MKALDGVLAVVVESAVSRGASLPPPLGAVCGGQAIRNLKRSYVIRPEKRKDRFCDT